MVTKSIVIRSWPNFSPTQVLSPSLPACGVAWPPGGGCGGAPGRTKPAAPAVAVTRPISVFVFTQLSLSSRGFLFLPFLSPHPFLPPPSAIPPLPLSACTPSNSSYLTSLAPLCPTVPPYPLVSLCPCRVSLRYPPATASFVSLSLSVLLCSLSLHFVPLCPTPVIAYSREKRE